jgi:hypothetical protein
MSQHDERDPERASQSEEGLRSRLQEFIPEVVKRTFLAGLGAVFTTEEGIRRLAQDSHLPKEVASYFLTQAQATKKELYRIFAGELRGWLDHLDLAQLLVRVLTSLTFEINTQVRLIPTGNNLVRPDIRPRVTVRRSSIAEEDESEDQAVTAAAQPEPNASSPPPLDVEQASPPDPEGPESGASGGSGSAIPAGKGHSRT